jgi:AcrR family transcriptional regulator
VTAGAKRRHAVEPRWKTAPVTPAGRRRPSTTRTPRTGRRPGTSTSREAILDAARRLFAERGYVGTSMRAIGTEAGVDASLIVHFFGTKAQLLSEAVEWPFDPDEEMARILAGGRRQLGEGLARLVVRTWDREGDRNAIMTLLRAATVEPAAAELLSEFFRRRLYRPLTEALSAPDVELRANLVASQLLGLGVARYVLRLEPLASMTEDEIVSWIGPTLQRYLTGRPPAGAER